MGVLLPQQWKGAPRERRGFRVLRKAPASTQLERVLIVRAAGILIKGFAAPPRLDAAVPGKRAAPI